MIIKRILAEISVLLILANSKFGNIGVQLKRYLSCMLTGPEKIVRRIVFLFSFFSTKFKMADESHVTLELELCLNCFTDLFKEATFSGHIRFWCDSDITFLRSLHKKFVTVLYFSIINVFWLLNLCGAGGDASFAPQANLVLIVI